MSLEKIVKQWQEDSKIDSTQLDQALVNLPLLHGKYLHLLTEARVKLKLNRLERGKVYHIAAQYCRGELNNKEDLTETGRQPNLHKVHVKADWREYANADPEVIKFDQRIVIHEETVDVLTEIMKQINQMSFTIRSLIDWFKLSGS